MILAIVGPTGVGKTKLSIELAKKYNAIIINCDAMQVYTGMDIGTAKIKDEEKEGIPHYLFDIKEIRDNYTVYDYQKDARELIEKFKDKKAENVLSSLEKSKHIELFRFIYGIGISEVGIKTAKDLAKTFKTFEGFKNATYEQLYAVEDIGDIIANNIIEFFKDEDNLKEIERLFEVGVVVSDESAQKSDIFAGMTFVLTGTLPNYSRSEMTKIIEDNGGKTATSVSKNTTYVLAGEEAGSKLDKAKSLGVPVLSEDEFVSKFLDIKR